MKLFPYYLRERKNIPARTAGRKSTGLLGLVRKSRTWRKHPVPLRNRPNRSKESTCSLQTKPLIRPSQKTKRCSSDSRLQGCRTHHASWFGSVFPSEIRQLVCCCRPAHYLRPPRRTTIPFGRPSAALPLPSGSFDTNCCRPDVFNG